MSKAVIVSSTSIALPLREVMSSYIDWCADGSGHTAKAKRYDLNHFYGFMARRAKRPFLYDVTRQAIEDFRDERLDQEEPTTVARRIATVKHFTKRCAIMFKDFCDPATEVRVPLVEVRKPVCLTDAELIRFRRTAQRIGRNEWFQARNRALIECALFTGLRCAELANLTEGQLSLERAELRLVRGKGRTFHTVPVPTHMMPGLLEWLEWRAAALAQVDRDYGKISVERRARFPLFLSLWGNVSGSAASYRMNEKTVWRVFRECGDAAGIEGMHTHRARHTFIEQYYKRTNDLRLTSRAARHTSVEMTMKYLTPDEQSFRAGFEE